VNPAKQGYNKTIGKFPEYIEEGERLQKKKIIFNQTDKAWRYFSFLNKKI
jgi:hypothetical protein